jgi:predicted GNAT superfamily acetyltransferase
MKTRKAAVIGATGVAGQEFLAPLAAHPLFEVTALAASPRSAGKKYQRAITSENGAVEWFCTEPLAPDFARMAVQDAATFDARDVDVAFTAVESDAAKELEPRYARSKPVISTASAFLTKPMCPSSTSEVMMNRTSTIRSSRAAAVTLRHCTLDDLPQLLRLNESALPHVSSLTFSSLHNLFTEAAWFNVATVQGGYAGFLIALRPGANYRSENYLWFGQRFANFLYIDRICIAPEFRRRGIASQLYADAEQFAREGHIPMLTCEVNLEPQNATSLAFHDNRQFEEVGSQRTESGAKLVSMRLKRLGSSALNESNQTRS